MKEKIEEILNEFDLTPSRFADIIQVQRSSISHIISGRNKPSLDFIQKILIAFPEINTDWLLLNKGDIFNKNQDNTKSINTNINTNTSNITNEETVVNNQIPNYNQTNINLKNIQLEDTPINYTPKTEEAPISKPHKHVPEIETEEEKTIEKIVFFYTDGTFKIYT